MTNATKIMSELKEQAVERATEGGHHRHASSDKVSVNGRAVSCCVVPKLSPSMKIILACEWHLDGARASAAKVKAAITAN